MRTAAPLFTLDQIEGMRRAASAFSRAIEAQMEAIVRVGRAMHTAVWAAYRAAGMPFGESEDGLLQWMRERQRAQALRDGVEREVGMER